MRLQKMRREKDLFPSRKEGGGHKTIGVITWFVVVVIAVLVMLVIYTGIATIHWLLPH